MSIYNETMSFPDPKIFDQTGWHKPEPEPLQRLCRNCRFWGSERDLVTPDGFKVCTKISEGEHRHYYEDGWWRDQLAHTTAYEESSLLTAPNFGCIHFEAKDED